MPDRPPLSAVLAVGGDSPLFRESLRSVLASDYPSLEVIVVDDGPPGSAIRGLPRGVRSVRTRGRTGPAAARNAGARLSGQPLLAFIDSDVVVAPDTLSRLEERMRARAARGAVAVQSPSTRFADLPSAYKNLFMHYSFERLGDGPTPSFYTCCAMVERAAFEAVGGFDEGYARPSIEDADLGRRLSAAGALVASGSGIWVEHARRYSAGGLLALDFGRATGIARMLLRGARAGRSAPGTVPGGFLAGAVLSTLMLLSSILWIVRGGAAWPAVAAGCCAAVVASNAGFLRAVARHAGPRAAAAAAAFLPVDLLASAAGAAWGIATFVAGRRY